MADVPVVTKVEPLDDYRLRLTFADGLVGEVDLGSDLWGPMFEPLRDPYVFARVRVDEEMGTVTWPNGADLDPCGLHADVSARPDPSPERLPA